jgi:2-polyprenyl-3-methyl-5-hydroxy-6-metoxy-1,4-benzoquinol methylase
MSVKTTSCPVCMSKECQVMIQNSKCPGPIVKCNICSFVFVNPIDKDYNLVDGPILEGKNSKLLISSKLSDINDSWEIPFIEIYLREVSSRQMNARNYLNIINKFTNEANGKILDIGSFIGVFLNETKKYGYDSYGIEPLVSPSIFARGHFGLKNIVTNKLVDHLYENDYFDLITAFQVFEHLPNPTEEIKICRKILKKNGLLVIEVPNIDTILLQIFRGKHRHFVRDHLSFFSAKTLKYFLEKNSFSVEYIYYPSRIMTVNHLLWWCSKYSKLVERALNYVIPEFIKEKSISINIRDIIAVIARKK